jgi:hypothetical protein
MKILVDRNLQYSITLKLSIILSEVVFICLFYFFPGFAPPVINKFDDPIILIDEIPITLQPSVEQFHKPNPPQIRIEETVEDPEILADITISEEDEDNIPGGKESSVADASLFSISKLPRQVLEVLPEQNRKNISGSVKLSLKINEFGKVVDHRILYNNLTCEDCLSEILAAAYKSKWESGIKDGIIKEYWVEKTYSFY